MTDDDKCAAFFAAIKRDPWAAIARPLPKRADRKTLLKISEMAALCGLLGPSLDDEYEHAATAMSRADADAFTARLIELGRRLEAAERVDLYIVADSGQVKASGASIRGSR